MAEQVVHLMCPSLSCGKILAVPEQVRGRIVRCTSCGISVRVPTSSPGQPDARADKAGKAA